MAKYYGKIGFIHTVEKVPGVWEECKTERPYYGDVIRNTRRRQSAEYLNDDLEISNEFSIVSDPYACQNFFAMRYIEWMGTLWKITNVEVQYPRLILTVGGVYNGQQTYTER